VKEEWLFPKSILEAHTVQKQMAQEIILRDDPKSSFLHIAGMDISNTPFDPEQKVFGAVVVLDFPQLCIKEIATQTERQTFPYIPGLLGFREAPVLLRAYSKLSIKPDLILVDGHGVSHPRGLGIASHLGVLLDTPTIGVAKSILVGKPERALPEEPGSSVPLVWKGRGLGMMLRTKKRCSPLIVSAGHRITLNTAVSIVLQCLKGYRLPEPTRQAHLAANACRKQFVSSNLSQ
jgi:deoxyribonuclease V